MEEQTTHPYPYREFLDDLLALGRVANSSDSETDQSRAFLEYFAGRYFPDAKKMVWRMSRCQAAAEFFRKNKDALDQGGLAVVGREFALVKGSMTTALWLLWAREDIHPETFDPPVSLLISTCEALKQA